MAKRVFDRRMAGALILVVAALLVDALATVHNIRQLHIDSGRVMQSYKVIEILRDVVTGITQAETSQRGYIITGNPSYLEPYNHNIDALTDDIAELERFYVFNPGQERRVRALKMAVNHRLKILHDNFALRNEKGLNAARKGILLAKGGAETEQIGDLADQWIAIERQLLNERLRRSQSNYHRTLLSAGILSAVCLLLIGVFAGVVRRYLNANARADRQLYEERELFQATLMSIADAVIATDAMGRVTYMNPIAQESTGWSWQKAAGEPLEQVFNIVDENSRKPVDSPAVRVLNEGNVVASADPMMLMTKAGHERPVEYSAAPIKNPDGHARGVVLIFRDVSASRRSQEQLRQSEMQFRHLAENLATSNRELEQFAYAASHDLQEPLHVIRSFIGLLRLRCEDKLDAKETEYLEYIRQAGMQAQALVKDLLEYSRLGKDVTAQVVDLEKVVEEVKANLRFAIEEAKGEIICGGLPHIKAVRCEIVQLFQNLISNAIKYAKPHTPPVVEISWSLLNNMYLFAIKDNGIGIEAQYKDRIFEMFQRLHSKAGSTGTGIGLAICKKIVEQHGGKIWMESGPQEGSVFYFTLKAA